METKDKKIQIHTIEKTSTSIFLLIARYPAKAESILSSYFQDKGVRHVLLW